MNDDIQMLSDKSEPPLEVKTEDERTTDKHDLAHNDIEDQQPDEKHYHDSTFNRNKTLIAQYVNRIIKDYPTPTERYYDIRLVASSRQNYFGEVGDQCVMFHSNKLCLVTLAPTHPVIAEDKTISKIDFKFEGDEKIDRLASQAKGKRKRGGQKLRKNSPICSVSCTDGSKYIVISCVSSRLVEVNTKIMSDPDLIKRRPLSEGYIAIIQATDWKHVDKTKDSFPKLGQTIQTTYEDEAGD
uniref:Protein Abitram n=1 Tax=Aceria tosichella TaxID=561515 RepID=A0A6G1SP89_9ACAR